jgi:diguanylate cyclase (GGDEF)-like protein
MPGVNGLDVCRLLRADPSWADLPVVCVASDATPERRFSAFDAGVDDFLVKPVLAGELLLRVRMRIDRARLRRDRADSDSLTGLLLRRAFLEQAGRCLAAGRDRGRVLSVSLLDLDGFKAVNDAHGHLAGDHVLAALGGVINRRLRLEDLRARWGGEEFAVVFPGQRRAAAALVLSRVLFEVRAMDFEGDRGELFHAGFSAGIAEFPADAGDLQGLLRVADRRLYRAKAAGRGRVERVG